MCTIGGISSGKNSKCKWCLEYRNFMFEKVLWFDFRDHLKKCMPQSFPIKHITDFVFWDILSKPEAYITHSSAILT